METTAEPSQVTPLHESPQGSPLLVFQLVNCAALFKEVYKTCNAWTATKRKDLRSNLISTPNIKTKLILQKQKSIKYK